MTRVLWTISLAALCGALGCDDLTDQSDDRRGSADDGDGDLDVGPTRPSDCGDDSPDAAGCPCTEGAAPRSCATAGEDKPEACSRGVQECLTETDGELASSAWGPCRASSDPAKEECGQPPGDHGDCVGEGCGNGDDNPGDDADCCVDEVAECLSSGESTAVCDALDQRCHGSACDGLTAICDPTALPVSKVCARLYQACFGFRVNKCVRESYEQCVSTMADPMLCSAWDAACGAREAYCASTVGSYESSNYPYSYACTDWGHDFDPCWAAYQACTLDSASCYDALDICLGTLGDIYEPMCSGGSGDNH